MQRGQAITFEIQSPYFPECKRVTGKVLRFERAGRDFATVDGGAAGIFGSVFQDVDGKFYTGLDAHQRRMRRAR